MKGVCCGVKANVSGNHLFIHDLREPFLVGAPLEISAFPESLKCIHGGNNLSFCVNGIVFAVIIHASHEHGDFLTARLIRSLVCDNGQRSLEEYCDV